jgi:uncharacterized membrane protein YbhN (UPF0104 family)
VSVVVLFAANLLWFHPANLRGTEFSRVRLAGAGLLALSVAGLVGLAWFRRRSRGAIRWVDEKLAKWSFVPARVRRAVVSLFEQLAGALSILADAREGAVVTGWSAVIWASIVLADWLVLRAFGLPFGLGETVFVLGWGLVGSLVPTPGGAAGAFHAAAAAGLIFLGVAREEAAAISIVMHLVVFGPALIFGLYYFLRGEIDVTRVRELARSEEVEHVIEGEIIHPTGVEEEEDLEVAHAGK